MMLMMSGLDCHRAPLDQRQRLSFSQALAEEFLHWLHAQPGVEGCVLRATCSRTGVYSSGSPELPWLLLCRGAGVPEGEMEC